jgi:hypothetical protein
MPHIAVDTLPGCEDIVSGDHGFSEPRGRAGGTRTRDRRIMSPLL